MVSSDPNNPQVYLERARYRRGFARTPDDVKAVTSDLERVLKQSGNEPDVYLELANVAQATGNIREALQVLETGLKAVPEAPSLHEALAMLEYRSGSMDKAIARLRRSVELLPNEASLHWTLANLLADRGDAIELRAQIDALRELNYSPLLVEFLEAYQQANSNEWQKARQTLIRLQTPFDAVADLKSRLNFLLAKCYGHLGDSERQRDAYRRAIAANPDVRTAAARPGVEPGLERRARAGHRGVPKTRESGAPGLEPAGPPVDQPEPAAAFGPARLDRG